MQSVLVEMRGLVSHGISGRACSGPRRAQAARIRIQRRSDSHICMAHPRRVAKVASQIQREISEMFIYDKVVQAAICPERRAGLDDKLSAVASITHVYVSNDLQVVKVYVSVYSDEQGKERAIDNLKQIAPYVRSQIGQAVKLRLTPEIRFEYDDTYDELEKIQEAIGQEDFNRYIAEAESERLGQPSSSSSSQSSALQNPFQHDNDGDDEDDAGFFDIADADAEISDLQNAGQASTSDGQTAGDSGQTSVRRVEWSRHDPETFFAVDVDSDDDDNDGDAADAWYSTAGPFDDLFGGSGDSLAQPRSETSKRRSRR